jgi:hypothetical protein
MELTFKYIWTNHLLKNNKECVHLWGQKIQRQHNNHNFECLYSMFANHHICVVCDLVYVILTIGIVQNSCIIPIILKS